MWKSNVKNSAVATWHTRISASEFSRFKSIHIDFQPNILWACSKEKHVTGVLYFSYTDDFKP